MKVGYDWQIDSYWVHCSTPGCRNTLRIDPREIAASMSPRELLAQQRFCGGCQLKAATPALPSLVCSGREKLTW
jgi:hypothetical protein